MRRETLEWEYVARWKRDDRVGISGSGEFAESAEDGDKILDGPIVIRDENERAIGTAAQEHEQQGFRRRREAGDTNPPRALPKVGGYTREGGKHFYVREEFADEGKKHAF